MILLDATPVDWWLGWLGVGPGAAVSLFANVESGIPGTVARRRVGRCPGRRVHARDVHAGALAEGRRPPPYPRRTRRTRPDLNGHAHRAAEPFAADLDAGRVPASAPSAPDCTSARTRPARYKRTCERSPVPRKHPARVHRLRQQHPGRAHSRRSEPIMSSAPTDPPAERRKRRTRCAPPTRPPRYASTRTRPPGPAYVDLTSGERAAAPADPRALADLGEREAARQRCAAARHGHRAAYHGAALARRTSPRRSGSRSGACSPSCAA